MPAKTETKPAPSPAAFSYTLADAGRMVGLHPMTLRRHAAAGRLKLIRLGGRTLVDGDSLRAMVRSAAA